MSSFLPRFVILMCLFYVLKSQPEEIFINDAMDSSVGWSSGGDSWIPITDSNCVSQSTCFELAGNGQGQAGGGWIEKTFTTSGYHDIRFDYLIYSNYINGGNIYMYTWDGNNQDSTYIYGPPPGGPVRMSAVPTPTSYWDDRTSFKIRVEMDTDSAVHIWISDLRIWGVPYTSNPTNNPTRDPTTAAPTTLIPTLIPSKIPSNIPSMSPVTLNPTKIPSIYPTSDPTVVPTIDPTYDPTVVPTFYPTDIPTFSPSFSPTITMYPTIDPTANPSGVPSIPPTDYPTPNPTPPEQQVGDTTMYTTHSGNPQPKKSGSDDDYMTLIIVIAALSCLFLIGCVIFVILYKRKNTALKKSEQRLTVLKQNSVANGITNDTTDGSDSNADDNVKNPGYLKQISTGSDLGVFPVTAGAMITVGGTSEIQLEGINKSTKQKMLNNDNDDSSDDNNNDLWLKSDDNNNKQHITAGGATPNGNNNDMNLNTPQ